MPLNRLLANVYLPSGLNRRISTTPGRVVQFFGGHAKIVNHLDMPHMLQLENARVQPEADAMPWALEWLRNTREIKAEVDWPDGWHVEFVNPEDFEVTQSDAPAQEQLPVVATTTEPEQTVDLTPHFGPFSPDDLLAGPEDESTPSSRRKKKVA
jgi:hypothetical protein